METCWRARVVPIGSAMIGTVIRRASTTDTTGGGGTRSASTLAVHPEIEREAQASARGRPARVPCLVSLTSTMIALLGKWSGRSVRPHGLGESGPCRYDSVQGGTTV